MSLIGKTIRCFTVVDAIRTPGKKTKYLLKCNLCGAEVIRGSSATQSGRISCDCIKKVTHERNYDRKSPLYNTYRAMLDRCYNPNSDGYEDYGGRGIYVCDEWQTYPAFEEWAYSNGWSEGLTIDRIEVNGNYEPSNCRWADKLQQANNTRRNRFYTYNGETLTMKQWADKIGISYYTLRNRLDGGWTIAEAVENKVRHTERVSKNDRLISYRGESKLLTQWAEELNIPFSTLRSRLERGQDIEKAFTSPVLQQERPIEFNGETHNLSEWSAIIGIDRGTLNSRIYTYGWSVEKAFTTPVKKKKKKGEG